VLFRDLPEVERLALMDKHDLSDPQMGLVTSLLSQGVSCDELHACLTELGTRLTTRDLKGLLRRGRGGVPPGDAAAAARLEALGVSKEDAANLLFGRAGRGVAGGPAAPEPELNLRGGGSSSDESSDDESSEEETESLAAILSRPREIPLPKGTVEADADGVFDLDDPSPQASSSAYASSGGECLD
jgi:hypothetical protein